MTDDHDHDDHDDHDHDDHHAHDASAVAVAVLTVSSSRTLEEDPAGDVIAAACEEEGHDVVGRRRVDDDRDAIVEAVAAAIDEDDADVVVTTGGTGLTPDDVTVEALRPLFDRRVPGFGELFRWLSYEEVGPMAMASRATAGVVDEQLVFCLPGSENAARTGAERLVAPAVGHLLGLVRR
ncbi:MULTISPECIES: MogA/MoaB family molybdenum cofactor biosynthesis protein [Haloarcula]|uniref:MogA/MoaB family molybdenum cofactor biosynthesis protein n=1 Tax=Haloarcula TaxID=2237 RepID=UPI0023EDB26D|nr:MogA/MoaB family molybdenum cofactor biosynthesis protein [Halomicroarcula sp. XH51]